MSARQFHDPESRSPQGLRDESRAAVQIDNLDLRFNTVPSATDASGRVLVFTASLLQPPIPTCSACLAAARSIHTTHLRPTLLTTPSPTMAALEFGLPSSLLLVGDPLDTPTDSLGQTAIGDAFIPTGLLLEEPIISKGTDGGESSRVSGGEFGGTSALQLSQNSLGLGFVANEMLARSFSAATPRRSCSSAVTTERSNTMQMHLFYLANLPFSPRTQIPNPSRKVSPICATSSHR